MNVIFNVEEYESAYGPIETWDEDEYLQRKYLEREEVRNYKSKLRQQRVLGEALLFLSAISALISKSVVEMYTVSFLIMIFGMALIFTRKVVIS